jgi:hypothetical protein
VSSDVTDYTLIRFLHSLDAAEKMGVKWDSTSAIYILQEACYYDFTDYRWGLNR